MLPSAATSATAEPEISAKNTEVPTSTIARPPRMKPSSEEAKAIRRRLMPEVFMIAPARMNSGMAISGKLLAPSYRVTAAVSRLSMPDEATIATAATTPNATAIGTLITLSARRPRNIASTVTPGSPRAPAPRSRPRPRASAREW